MNISRAQRTRRVIAVAIILTGAGAGVTIASAQQQANQTSKAPQTITMDQLDDNPQSFIDRQVSVQAEVQEVLGPRLFTIDEQEWFDFDGDTLVFIHAPFAGLISEDARVTVMGTVRPFVLAEVQREWGVFDLDPEIEVEFKDRPILVATSVKSDQGVELAVSMVPAKPAASRQSGQTGATGTSGSTATAPASSKVVSDVGQLATSMDRRLVGRRVNISKARVVAEGWDGTVWVSPPQGDGRLLVVPMSDEIKTPAVGQTVSIQGVVLEAPESVYARARQEKKGDAEETIYVFASTVQAPQG